MHIRLREEGVEWTPERELGVGKRKGGGRGATYQAVKTVVRVQQVDAPPLIPEKGRRFGEAERAGFGVVEANLARGGVQPLPELASSGVALALQPIFRVRMVRHHDITLESG